MTESSAVAFFGYCWRQGDNFPPANAIPGEGLLALFPGLLVDYYPSAEGLPLLYVACRESVVHVRPGEPQVFPSYGNSVWFDWLKSFFETLRIVPPTPQADWWIVPGWGEQKS